jgi:hypothetical protein
LFVGESIVSNHNLQETTAHQISPKKIRATLIITNIQLTTTKEETILFIGQQQTQKKSV